MKQFRIIALAVLALIAFACKQPEPAFLTLKSAAAENVDQEGGVVNISFTTNASWTAVSSDSWLTLSQASGEGVEGGSDFSIKASAVKNETTDSRSATVTIKGPEGSKLDQTVTITQGQTDAISIATAEYTVPAEGGTVEVAVSANVDYEVVVPEAVDWIHVAGTKAMKDSKVTLAVDATELYEFNESWEIVPGTIVRSANITIKHGGLSEVVKVQQTTFEPYFEYQGDWAGLQWSFYEGAPTILPQEGVDIEIDVATNIGWRAYMSRWDDALQAGVDIMDNGWAHLSFDADKGKIYLKIDPNDTYIARDDYLYTVGFTNGEEDGNFGGLGWFRQPGLTPEGCVATLAWNKTISDMGITPGYNRLAYKTAGGDALLMSDGEKVYALSPADGTFWKSITWGSVKPTSICSDDAGNVIVGEDIPFESGTTYKVYYTSDVNQDPVVLFEHTADFAGTIGGWRVRGDISDRAVVTGFVGGTRYWCGWEIDKKAISYDNYYNVNGQARGPIAVDGDAWTPEAGAVISLGPKLGEGIVYRAYDTGQQLWYLADAYTPNWIVPYNWQLISEAGAGGNENQNNLAVVDYKGRRILAYTQGYHFSWSGNGTIFIFDVTDIQNVKTLATIEASEYLMDVDFTGANSADVLLHPTEDNLVLYVVHSGKNTLARFDIIIG